MCPLFRHYTLHSIFARHHLHDDETGSFTHSALISLLLQNVLELSCNFIKTSYPESEEWSRFNCTMGSMAQFCFSLDTHQELSSLLLTGAASEGNPNPDARRVQSWLRKAVPGREPTPGVLQNLFPLLHNLFSKCDLPADATAEQITCMPFVNQSGM
ncbi:hypothetical protein GBAR_LOCUS21289 [Geodia barretti]|uniref:Uncharacterized protein n=1 Tax=Geodia barretti TaxID=519541 RepID=A0AA35SZ64_GEOBA|nr:hypothetical protein GBAR_LOCUS21289 [Geodia barretti]